MSKELKDPIHIVNDYLNELDWRVKENSNQIYSFSGLNLHIASSVIAMYTLNKIYPEKLAKRHSDGWFHIHDLGQGIIGYCSGWSLKQLITKGFGGVPAYCEAKPAKHLDSIVWQMINFLGVVQNEWAGAQAFNSVDTYLAPYVRKDKLDYKQVKQCVQAFIYNSNIPSRWGGQAPFINVTMDLTPPEDLKNQAAMVGNEIMNFTYGDLQEEIDMINRAFLEIMLDGDARHKPFTFPIPTYNITKDFDWDSDIADLLFEVTGKYGIPYFQNFVNSDLDPGDVRSMCCRLQLNLKELKKKTGGLFGAGEQTGCYDEKTKVLTDKGWKYFKDVNINDDKIATLDPKTHEVKFVNASRKFVYDYDGNLIQFYNESGFESPLLTPNHRMYVEVLKEKEYEAIFKEARENFSSSKYTVPKTGVWKGKKQEYLDIPGVVVEIDQEVRNGFYKGKRKIKKEYPTLKFKTNDFLEFLGIFIGDGSARIKRNGGYEIILSHGDNERKKEYYSEILDKLGLKYREDNNNFVLYSIQIYKYLDENVGFDFDKKRIPRNILELDMNHLNYLWKGLLYSDGSVHKIVGTKVYYTSNKKLAYDVLELLVKLGYSGRIVKRDPRMSKIDGRKINSKETYEVVLRKTKRLYYSRLKKRNIKYNGKVYCLEVPPYHTMLVEREGNILWCGNSIGVCTINMPRIGYLAKDENEFFELLEELMNDAKEVLEIKRKVIKKNYERGLMPYTKVYLRSFDTYFSTVGLVGVNEACLNLLGVNIADPEGHKFAVKVMDFMRNKITEFQEETGNLYNLEATPAESTAYRLARIDKKKYSDIIVANEFSSYKETGVPYYTNSTQLPVDYTDDLFFTLKHQEPLQSRYTGGTVLHIYLDEPVDKDTAKLLIKKMVHGFRIPYYSISPRFSICPVHGYIPGWVDKCPY